MTNDELDQRLSDLPSGIEPSTDLWPAIDATLEVRIRRRDRWRAVRPWIAAAALVVVTVAVTRGVSQPVDPPEPTWQEQMASASSALEAAVAARTDLDPATRAEIDAHLALIDKAIAECAAALETRPGDPVALTALVEAWRSRIGLLEHARDLDPPT